MLAMGLIYLPILVVIAISEGIRGRKIEKYI